MSRVSSTTDAEKSSNEVAVIEKSHSSIKTRFSAAEDEVPNSMYMGITVKWALSMSHCRLDNINVLLNDSLLVLSLTHCGLTHCEFLPMCPLLHFVDLSHNSIDHVPNTIAELAELEVLRVGHNKLSKLRNIEHLCGYSGQGEHHLTRLYQLQLEGNPLCEMKRYRAQVLTQLLTVPRSEAPPPTVLTDVMLASNLLVLDRTVISDEERHMVLCRYFIAHAQPLPPKPVVKSEEELAAEARALREEAEHRRRQEILRREAGPHKAAYHGATGDRRSSSLGQPLWQMLQSLPGDGNGNGNGNGSTAGGATAAAASALGRRQSRAVELHLARTTGKGRGRGSVFAAPTQRGVHQTEEEGVDIYGGQQDGRAEGGTGDAAGSATAVHIPTPDAAPAPAAVAAAVAAAAVTVRESFRPESAHTGPQQREAIRARRFYCEFAPESLTCCVKVLGRPQLNRRNTNSTRRLLANSTQGSMAQVAGSVGVAHEEVLLNLRLQRALLVRMVSTVSAVSLIQRNYRYYRFRQQFSLGFRALVVRMQASFRARRLRARWFRELATLASANHINIFRLDELDGDDDLVSVVETDSGLKILSANARGDAATQHHAGGCIRARWLYHRRVRCRSLLRRAVLRYVHRRRYLLRLLRNNAARSVIITAAPGLQEYVTAALRFLTSTNHYLRHVEAQAIVRVKAEDAAVAAAAAEEAANYGGSADPKPVPKLITDPKENEVAYCCELGRHDYIRVNSSAATSGAVVSTPVPVLSLHQNPIPRPAVPKKSAAQAAAEVVTKLQLEQQKAVALDPPSEGESAHDSTQAEAPPPPLPAAPAAPAAAAPVEFERPPPAPTICFSPEAVASVFRAPASKVPVKRVNARIAKQYLHTGARLWYGYTDLNPKYDFRLKPPAEPEPEPEPVPQSPTKATAKATAAADQKGVLSAAVSVAVTAAAGGGMSVAPSPGRRSAPSTPILPSRSLSLRQGLRPEPEPEPEPVREPTEAELREERSRVHRLQRAIDAFNFYMPSGARSSAYEALVQAATAPLVAGAGGVAADAGDSLLSQLDPTKSVEQRRLKILRQRGMMHIGPRHYFLSSNCKPRVNAAAAPDTPNPKKDPYVAVARARSPLLGRVGGSSTPNPNLGTSSSTKKTLAVRAYDMQYPPSGPDGRSEPYFVRGYDCNDPGVGVYTIHLRDGVDSAALYHIVQCLSSLDRYISISNKLFPRRRGASSQSLGQSMQQSQSHNRALSQAWAKTGQSPPFVRIWDFQALRMVAVQVVQRAWRGHRCRRELFRKRFAGDDRDFISDIIRNRAAIAIQRCSRLRHGLLKRLWLLQTIQNACRGISVKNPVIYLDSWVYFLLLRHSRQRHPFIAGKGGAPGAGPGLGYDGGLPLPDVSPRIRRLWAEFQGYPSLGTRGEGLLIIPPSHDQPTTVRMPTSRPSPADEADGVEAKAEAGEALRGEGLYSAAPTGTIKRREHVGPSSCRLPIHRPARAPAPPTAEAAQEPHIPVSPHPRHRRPHATSHGHGHGHGHGHYNHHRGHSEDHGFSRPDTGSGPVAMSIGAYGPGHGEDDDDDGELVLNLEAGKEGLEAGLGLGVESGSLDGRGRELSMHLDSTSASVSVVESMPLSESHSRAHSPSQLVESLSRQSHHSHHHSQHSQGQGQGQADRGHTALSPRARSAVDSPRRRPHTVAAAEAAPVDSPRREVHNFTMGDVPSPRPYSNHHHHHSAVRHHHPAVQHHHAAHHSHSHDHSHSHGHGHGHGHGHHRRHGHGHHRGHRHGGSADVAHAPRAATDPDPEQYPCKLFDLLTRHVQSIRMPIYQPQASTLTPMGNFLENLHTEPADDEEQGRAPDGSGSPPRVSRRHSTASAPDNKAPKKRPVKPPKYNVKAGALRVVELRFKTCVEARARMMMVILATFDGFRRRALVPMSEANVQQRVNDMAIIINAHVRPPPKKEELVMPIGHIKLDHTPEVKNTEYGEKGVDTKVLENSIIVRSDNKFKSLMTRPLSGVAAARPQKPSGRAKGPMSPGRAVAARGRAGSSSADGALSEPTVLNDTSIEPKLLLLPQPTYPRAILDCVTRCAALPPPKEGEFESEAQYHLAVMRGDIPASREIQLFALMCYVLSLDPRELHSLYGQLRGYLLPRGQRLEDGDRDGPVKAAGAASVGPAGAGAAGTCGHGPDCVCCGRKERQSVLSLPGSMPATALATAAASDDQTPMFRMKDVTDALPPAAKRPAGTPDAQGPPLDDEIGDDWEQDQDSAVQARESKVQALTEQATEENRAKSAARARRRNTTLGAGAGTGTGSLSQLAYESPMLYQDFRRLKEQGTAVHVEKRAMAPPPLPGAAPTVAEVNAAESAGDEAEEVQEEPEMPPISEEQVVIMRNSLLLWCSQLEKGTLPDGLPGSEPEILSVEAEEKTIPALPRGFHAPKSCYRMTVAEAMVLASTVIEPEFKGSQTTSHYTTFSEKRAEAQEHIKELERAMSLERLEVLNHYKLHKHRTQQRMKQAERQRVLKATVGAPVGQSAKSNFNARAHASDTDGDTEAGSSIEISPRPPLGAGASTSVAQESTVDGLVRAAQGGADDWPARSPQGAEEAATAANTAENTGTGAGKPDRPKSAAMAKHDAKMAFTRSKNTVDRQELHAEVELLRHLEQDRRAHNRAAVRAAEARSLEYAAEQREVRHQMAKLSVYTQEIDNAMRLEGRDLEEEEQLEAKRRKKTAEERMRASQRDFRGAARESGNILAQLARREQAHATQALLRSQVEAKRETIARARLSESDSKRKLAEKKEVERLSRRNGRPNSAGVPRRGRHADVGNNIQLAPSQLVEGPFDDSIADTADNTQRGLAGTARPGTVMNANAQRLSVHIDHPKQLPARRRHNSSLISPMMSGEVSWQGEGPGLELDQDINMHFSASLVDVDVSTVEPLAGGLGGQPTFASSAPQYSSSTVAAIPQVQMLAPDPLATPRKEAAPTPFSRGTVQSGKAAINSFFARQLAAASAAAATGSGSGAPRRPASAAARSSLPLPGAQRGAPAGASQGVKIKATAAGPAQRDGAALAMSGSGSISLRERSSVSESLKEKSLAELVSPLTDLVAPYCEEDEFARRRGPVPQIRQYTHLQQQQQQQPRGTDAVGVGIGFDSVGSGSAAMGSAVIGSGIGSGSGSGSGSWREPLAPRPGSRGSASVKLRPPSPNRGTPPGHTETGKATTGR